MEKYSLKSKVTINGCEYLIQTVNDTAMAAIVVSLFADGEVLESSRYPYMGITSEKEILQMVKRIHDDKKYELDSLFANYDEALKSGNTKLMYHLGVAFYNKRIFDEAYHLFTCITEMKAEDHQALCHLGLTCMELDQISDACKHLGMAVQLRPGFADFRNHYGEALLKADDFKGAVEQFQEAINLNIYYADAYYNMGLAYIVNALRREDYDMYNNMVKKATDIFERAVLIDPEYKSAEFDQGMRMLQKGDYKLALDIFENVKRERRLASRKIVPGASSRFLLYTDWSDEASLNNRIKFLREEINRNPSYADFQLELGLCHLQKALFDWEEALDNFEKALEINPKLNKGQKSLELAQDFHGQLKGRIDSIVREEFPDKKSAWKNHEKSKA